jgi:hypothetical protein
MVFTHGSDSVKTSTKSDVDSGKLDKVMRAIDSARKNAPGRNVTLKQLATEIIQNLNALETDTQEREIDRLDQAAADATDPDLRRGYTALAAEARKRKHG